MLSRIVLGTKQNFTASSYEDILLEDNLCDNQWHQVNLKILQDKTYAKVDIGESFIAKTKFRYKFDEKVVIGGLPEQQTLLPVASKRNYAGCLNYVVLNEMDILQSLHRQNRQLVWHCQDSKNFDIINFHKKDSYVDWINPLAASVDIGLLFRTYYQDGVLITNEIYNQPTVKHASENIMGFTLYFEKNVVKLGVQGSTVISIRPKEDIDFGSWHEIKLHIKKDLVTLTVGSVSRVSVLKRTTNSNLGKSLVFGKQARVTRAFHGWMWNITLNNQKFTYLNASTLSGVSIGISQMKDYCYPNPCQNGARCMQSHNGSHCNCSETGFDGPTCSTRSKKYKRSCEEYFRSGKHQNGLYMIMPGKKLFTVFCKMDDPKGPVTVVRPRQGTQLRAVYETGSSDTDYYYHEIKYRIRMREIDEIISSSGHCRQYIEFSCSSSTLMFSNDKENAIANRYGARWYSKMGKIQNYWGGGTKDGYNCACGVAGNCADHKLKCNCDSMDTEWRSDGGYLLDKEDLPVSRIQFSKKYTNPSAMFRLGSLECYGEEAKTTKKPKSTLAAVLANSSSPSIVSATTTQTQQTNTKDHTTRKLLLIGKTSSTVRSTKPTSATKTRVSASPTIATDGISFQAKTNEESRGNNSLNASTISALSVVISKTRLGGLIKSTSRSLLIDRPAEESENSLSNKQTYIMIALISSLTLLTILLIFAVIRQRLFRSNKKLTIELKQDPECGSTYSVKPPSNGSFSPSSDSRQYQSSSDVNKIEIIKVASPFRKPLVSESEGSVSSFETSRYLEVGDESDSGSTSSYAKPKGILKSKRQFVMGSRPRSEGDQFEADDPGEIIGLIHIRNSKEEHIRSGEQTSLLSDSKSDSNYLQFHLHPKNLNRIRQARSNSSRLSQSDRESVDADAGFITDSSSSCDSRKSLSSYGSEESNDENYSKKNFRPKRSVRFSIQELAPSTTIKTEDAYINCNEGDDEVFT